MTGKKRAMSASAFLFSGQLNRETGWEDQISHAWEKTGAACCAPKDKMAT